MAHQQEAAEGGAHPCGTIVPISISDKAMLVMEEMSLPPSTPPRRDSLRNEKKGRLTWLMAAFALPTVGICLLLTLFIMADPVDSPGKMGRLRSSQIPRKTIFIVDINSNNYPTSGKLTALETCLKTNKHSELYLITLNKYIDQPRNTSAFEKMKKKYSNFHYLFQNVPSYFRGSLFEDAVNSPPKDMLFKAQLLILWRYGGMVISPSWIPLKPIEKIMFPKNDGSVLVGSYNGQIGVMSVSNTCNAKLFDIMTEVKKLNSSKTSEMEVVDRVILKWKSGFKRLGFPQLCNNVTHNEQCVLMKADKSAERFTINPAVKKIIIPSVIDSAPPPTDVTPTFFRRFFIFT